jgi:hypothetical protein
MKSWLVVGDLSEGLLEVKDSFRGQLIIMRVLEESQSSVEAIFGV